MLYLTKLKLQNFCNYESYTFDLKQQNGSPYRYVCLYGPNGFGKTSLLEAISLLTANQTQRDQESVKRSLRKYVRNKDYNLYEKISGYKYSDELITDYKDNLQDMVIEGTYELDEKEYVVTLTQNGFVRNDFNPGPWGDKHLLYRQRISHFITSDNDLALSKFQLRSSQIKTFEEIISTVMRFKAECIPPSGVHLMDHDYCTDFVIHKKDHKIHYKRMSAGEKKIAKSFSQLLNLVYDLEHPNRGEIVLKNYPRILLLDNIEMHIYYDRHVAMVDCIKKYFPTQQIFATTHSSVLIERHLRHENNVDELMIDLEGINC